MARVLDVIQHGFMCQQGSPVLDGFKYTSVLPLIVLDRIRVIQHIRRTEELAARISNGSLQSLTPCRPCYCIMESRVCKPVFSPVGCRGLLADGGHHGVKVVLRSPRGCQGRRMGLHGNSHGGEVVQLFLLLEHASTPFCKRLAQGCDEIATGFASPDHNVAFLLQLLEGFPKTHPCYAKGFSKLPLWGKPVSGAEFASPDQSLDVLRHSLGNGH